MASTPAPDGRIQEGLENCSSDRDDLDRLTGPEPPPDLAAAFADEVRQRLAELPGDDLRRVALARLEGDTVAEAATRLAVSRRVVERNLPLAWKWADL